MRALWCSLVVVLVHAQAYARNPHVVVMSDPADAAALRVTMRGVELTPLPAPEGGLRLDRAAVVQRATVDVGADAGVWVDADEVCVVSADGKVLRHAPLPAERSPRIVAAIATSLLEEVLSPEDAGVGIDFHIEITPPVAETPPPPRAIVPPSATPGLAIQSDALRDPVRWDRTLVEIGPMASPLSFGIEAEVAFPVSRRLRFGVLGIANTLPSDKWAPLFGGAFELRHVGRGSRHFDIGLIGGAAAAEGDPVGFTSVRLGITWEGAGSGLGVSLSPTLFFPGTHDPVLPGIWASIRWELPV
jgi:hypothetical protein